MLFSPTYKGDVYSRWLGHTQNELLLCICPVFNPIDEGDALIDLS